MQRARILLVLGIWVVILPYLGFPESWKNVLFTLTGFCLVCFSYVLYKEFQIKIGASKKKVFDTFSENRNFNEENN
ncbi:MAG: hypothetical protein V4439_02955 [Patescibacteria group bacterium]